MAQDDLAKRVAKNVEKMFRQPTYIHSQNPITGEHVVSDTNGKEISRTPAVLNPLNGKPFKFLHSYAAKCIKTRQNDPEYPAVGELIIVDYISIKYFYMNNNEGLCCHSSAQLGIDFELLDIPGNDVGKAHDQPGWHLDKHFCKLQKAFWDSQGKH